jgi:hypothetical protein
MELGFGQRISLLDDVGGFRPGDRQECPVLRVVATQSTVSVKTETKR